MSEYKSLLRKRKITKDAIIILDKIKKVLVNKLLSSLKLSKGNLDLAVNLTLKGSLAGNAKSYALKFKYNTSKKYLLRIVEYLISRIINNTTRLVTPDKINRSIDEQPNIKQTLTSSIVLVGGCHTKRKSLVNKTNIDLTPLLDVVGVQIISNNVKNRIIKEIYHFIDEIVCAFPKNKKINDKNISEIEEFKGIELIYSPGFPNKMCKFNNQKSCLFLNIKKFDSLFKNIKITKNAKLLTQAIIENKIINLLKNTLLINNNKLTITNLNLVLKIKNS
jgi:hypothetical protein